MEDAEGDIYLSIADLTKASTIFGLSKVNNTAHHQSRQPAILVFLPCTYSFIRTEYSHSNLIPCFP